MPQRLLKYILLPLLSLCTAVPVYAAPTLPTAQVAPTHLPRTVAYDAKDKRYYSVAYAKAHAMHDKGGDPLTIVSSSSLPKEAKMSRAMHGKM